MTDCGYCHRPALLLLLSVGGSIECALHRRWLRKSPEEQAAVMRHDE
jgi:putative Mg2+ transporter-C (MgtC) family protein